MSAGEGGKRSRESVREAAGAARAKLGNCRFRVRVSMHVRWRWDGGREEGPEEPEHIDCVGAGTNDVTHVTPDVAALQGGVGVGIGIQVGIQVGVQVRVRVR